MPHKYRYLFCVKNVEKTELSPHFNHDFYPKNTDIFFVWKMWKYGIEFALTIHF